MLHKNTANAVFLTDVALWHYHVNLIKYICKKYIYIISNDKQIQTARYLKHNYYGDALLIWGYQVNCILCGLQVVPECMTCCRYERQQLGDDVTLLLWWNTTWLFSQGCMTICRSFWFFFRKSNLMNSVSLWRFFTNKTVYPLLNSITLRYDNKHGRPRS